MGKAADNERIKLLATFLNNLAVATIVAGFLVPFFSFIFTKDAMEVPLYEAVSVFRVRVAMGSILISGTVAGLLRFWATFVIGKIQD
jgi:hypothetical protein